MENINFRNNLSPVSLLLGRLLCPAHGQKSPEALTLITGRQFEDGPVVEWHRQRVYQREREIEDRRVGELQADLGPAFRSLSFIDSC